MQELLALHLANFPCESWSKNFIFKTLLDCFAVLRSVLVFQIIIKIHLQHIERSDSFRDVPTICRVKGARAPLRGVGQSPTNPRCRGVGQSPTSLRISVRRSDNIGKALNFIFFHNSRKVCNYVTTSKGVYKVCSTNFYRRRTREHHFDYVFGT